MYRGTVYRLGSNQTAAYTTGSVAISNAFGAGTNAVRVIATTRCHVKIGNSPTATTSDPLLASGVPEYFVATPGMKAAAIRTATNGTLHVTELSG